MVGSRPDADERPSEFEPRKRGLEAPQNGDSNYTIHNPKSLILGESRVVVRHRSARRSDLPQAFLEAKLNTYSGPDFQHQDSLRVNAQVPTISCWFEFSGIRNEPNNFN